MVWLVGYTGFRIVDLGEYQKAVTTPIINVRTTGDSASPNLVVIAFFSPTAVAGGASRCLSLCHGSLLKYLWPNTFIY